MTTEPSAAAPAHGRYSTGGVLIAVWGITGVCATLLIAVWRMGSRTIEAADYSFTWLHWLTLAGCLAFMAYTEGYRGFQKGFSPRVVARALHLAARPRPLLGIFAPFFCMSLFGASRRRLIATWILVAMIVGFILAIRQLPQPWRGIIDAGVVLGLAWGLVTILWHALRAATGRPPTVPLDLPT